ncbi:MAG: serine protease [Acidimicrobiales bacterium]
MALIPPLFLNAVVTIGDRDPEGIVSWVATGFFIGTPAPDEPGRYGTWLVTNRHVVEGLTNPVIRLNPIGSDPAQEMNLRINDETGNPLWTFHASEDIDVAITAIPLGHESLTGFERNFFELDNHALNIAQLKESGISEGSHVVVMGFPMQIIGAVRKAVLVRSGSIAQISDLLSGYLPTFLVDATVLPGNSGGPVVNLPEMIAIQGTKNQATSNLIGIISAYLPYQEVAVSPQTGRTRVVFEENSGLGIVYPVDAILQTIELARVRAASAE